MLPLPILAFKRLTVYRERLRRKQTRKSICYRIVLYFIKDAFEAHRGEVHAQPPGGITSKPWPAGYAERQPVKWVKGNHIPEINKVTSRTKSKKEHGALWDVKWGEELESSFKGSYGQK